MRRLQYPLTLDTNHTDYVVFSHEPYRTNSTHGVGGGGGGHSAFSNVSPPNLNDSVVLYMPNSTPQMNNGNTWSEAKFDGPLGDLQQSVGRTASNAVMGAVKSENMADLKATAGQAAEDIGGTLARGIDNTPAIAGQVAMEAIGTVLPAFGSANNLLAFTQGQIYNPNVELLYQGPALRSFGMAFNFICRSPKESDRVDNIIMEFKKWSAADDQGEYLAVPHIWNITYMFKDGVHPKMNRFKKCALTSVNVVDNGSSDTHTTFEDGTPTTTTLSLSFSEVDVIYRHDHVMANKFGYKRGY